MLLIEGEQGTSVDGPTTPTPATSAATDTASAPAAPATATTDAIVVRRRTVDTVLIVAGVVITAVLVAAGALLTWGSNFAEDYVNDELAAQQIFFPDAAELEDQGRGDLVKYAEEQVTTGPEAEAYASFINGHLEGIAGGETYATIGDPLGEARTALEEAQASGADDAEIADLQATVDELSSQRDSLFRGETLRGLLLSTFAWSTIGRIAGIAAVCAFVAAGLMAVLVALGLVHRIRPTHRTV
jgi:hypothetical protein